jgi:hypothetical protein
MSLNMLGAHRIGDTTDTIISTLTTAAPAIKTMYDKNEAEKKATADAATKLKAAIAADSAKAVADAQFATSTAIAAMPQANPDVKDKVAADKLAATAADAAQIIALSALPADQLPRRLEAANAELKTAVSKLQDDPKSVFNKSLVSAWQGIVSGSTAAAVKAEPGDHAGGPSGGVGSFFLRQIGGTPIRVWHVGVGVVGAGGLWYAIKKGFFRKLFGG